MPSRGRQSDSSGEVRQSRKARGPPRRGPGVALFEPAPTGPRFTFHAYALDRPPPLAHGNPLAPRHDHDVHPALRVVEAQPVQLGQVHGGAPDAGPRLLAERAPAAAAPMRRRASRRDDAHAADRVRRRSPHRACARPERARRPRARGGGGAARPTGARRRERRAGFDLRLGFEHGVEPRRGVLAEREQRVEQVQPGLHDLHAPRARGDRDEAEAPGLVAQGCRASRPSRSRSRTPRAHASRRACARPSALRARGGAARERVGGAGARGAGRRPYDERGEQDGHRGSKRLRGACVRLSTGGAMVALRGPAPATTFCRASPRSLSARAAARASARPGRSADRDRPRRAVRGRTPRARRRDGLP